MVIGVGVAGYGYAGRSFHTYLVPLATGLELRAVATRDRERRARAAAERAVVTYESIDELLRDPRIQLVVVATPHDTHESLAIQAMDAGRHVVVDKAMCLNVREADRMIAAAQRNGVMLSVFQNRRWDWDYLTVRKLLSDGVLGTTTLIEAAVLRYRSPRGWRSSFDRGGGILYDWGAHLIDQALDLVPERVTRVSCEIQYRGWGAEIGSYGRIVLHFASGLLYQIEVGNLTAAPRPRWYILGESGAFVRQALDQQEPALVAGDIDAAIELPEHEGKLFIAADGHVVERACPSVRGSWKSYYQNVADHLLHGASLAVTAGQVRRQIAVFDAAREAARTGAAVQPAGEEDGAPPAR